MNDEAGPCPSAAEIEAIASGGPGEPALREHVLVCVSCRELLESAKFEHQFAAALNAGAKNAAMAEMPNPSLPGYEIVREVSRGGQGIVYEAIQTRTRRRVALKVLRQDHGISRSQRARFDREIEIAAALKHPGIVGVYDSIAMPGGRHALVLEFVEGEALDRQCFASEDEKVRPQAAVELIAKVCDAIHYAHQRGVIHRDLKPSNILVDASGQPRVLDFGVACWFGAPGADAARITLTGEFAGTLAYAAPEQVSGVAGAPDLRSDLYALGVMLYQLCFGGLPYDVSGPLDSAIRNIIESSPTRTPGGHGAAVDEDLWVIINKALSKEPDRRYQSAAAMGADLRRYLSGETIEARRDSRMYVFRKTISRHRYAAGATLATFAGLAAFGVSVALSNARLSEALRTSTFERARALGAAGSRPEADMLLWPDILRLGPALLDPEQSVFHGTAEERRVLWAFVEMQGAAPCLASAAPPQVRRTSFTCTNDRMMSMTIDGELSEWSIPDLRLLSNRRVFRKQIQDLLVSIPGNLCVGFDRPDLVVMDLSGKELARRSFVEDIRVGLRMSKDGRRMVAWSKATGVQVFELPSLQPVFQKVGDMSLHAPWLSESGDRVGIVLEDREVVLYHLPEGTQESSWPLANVTETPVANHSSIFQNLVVSEQADRMAVVAGHHLYVRQGVGGAESKLWSVTIGSIANPSFSSSGQWMLTRGDADPVVKLWRAGDWTQQSVYPGHAEQALGAIMTPDERHIVTVDALGAFRVWPGPRAEAIWELPGSNVNPHDLAIDEGGRTLWAATSDGRVGRWGLDGSAAPEFVRVDSATAFTVAYSSQVGVLAATGHGGVVSLFDRESKCFRALDGMGSEGVSCVRFSPDGSRLAACGRFGPIVIFDTTTWDRIANIKTDGDRIVMARWSPDGKMLGIAAASFPGVQGTKGNCEIYDVAAARLLNRWAAHPLACRAIGFSPNGETIATVGNDGMLHLRDAKTREPIGVMPVNNSNLFCLAFHADGHVLAVGDRSGRVTLIGLPEQKVLAHFDCGIPIMAIEFVGDRLVLAPLDLPITVRDFGMIARCIPGNVEFWKSSLSRQGVAGPRGGK